MTSQSASLDREALRSRAIEYVRVEPDDRFWSAHWASQSIEHMLAVAETTELTRFLERHIRPGARLLEGGCGLGQYVVYFRRRGLDAAGVDYSSEAIARHRAVFPESDVRVGDLSELPCADASFDVYLSLGVIEHYRDGGRAILAEARRVLRDDGALLLSTPYVNLSRRLLRRSIERRQEELARAGGSFYQYAFDERTLDELLARAGFAVAERSYYDPGRGLRDVRALLRPGARTAAGNTAHAPRRHGAVKRAVLYSRPMLKTLAHMQIVCAVKSRGRGSA